MTRQPKIGKIYRLTNISKQYGMTAFMANFIGPSGGYECAGKSIIWNHKAEIIFQLDGNEEALY